MKKVIFLMIDSLMPHVLEDCIQKRLVPALQFFKENGMYWKECITVYPTMTASVDCSLVTGEYPDRHKVPALVWYDPKDNRLVNYINGSLPVWKLGLTPCVHDVLCALNDLHLSKEVKTIYEELAYRGRTSGSINLIARRSHQKYKVNLPWLLRLVTRFRAFEDISGPDLLTVGSIVRSPVQPAIPWGWDETVFKQYGINDAFAVRVLNHLISHQIIPDFTMVYLPENDHQVHLKPKKACRILTKVDQKLQTILNQFPSWEAALEKYVFIITGDHGQTVIGPSSEHNIDLEHLLIGMKINMYGEQPTDQDDVVLANNERMTNIYPLKEGVEQEVVFRLKQDPRIDIIAWKKEDWVHVCSGEIEGFLRFRKNGNLQDVYGQSWELDGDTGILELTVSSERKITFGNYPDVLSRLYGALFSQNISIISCTAKPGYEFKSTFAPTHLNGGSHGSLHRVDSTIPLIISGAGQSEWPFQFPRLVDLKNYILHLLQ